MFICKSDKISAFGYKVTLFRLSSKAVLADNIIINKNG